MIQYRNIYMGTFLDRPNRFIAHVNISGRKETVHVKNTGRCKELLLPGALVGIQYVEDEKRKTKWDLISVYKRDFGWINIDSQLPNKVVLEWIQSGQSVFWMPDKIKPEYVYGNSRIDFYLESKQRKILLEVKGCTLEVNGKGFFPDAPTARGAKHLMELAKAVQDGYDSYLLYCITMNGIEIVLPNKEMDPDYAEALEKAMMAGVKVIFLPCKVSEGSVEYADHYKVL